MGKRRNAADYEAALVIIEDYRFNKGETGDIKDFTLAQYPNQDSTVRAAHAAVKQLGYMAKIDGRYVKTDKWKKAKPGEVAKACMEHELAKSKAAQNRFRQKAKQAIPNGAEINGLKATQIVIDEMDDKALYNLLQQILPVLEARGYRQDETGRWYKETREYL